jgi:hypothetical protein
MVGRRSPQSPSISRLTSQPETIPSCYRRSRHTEFQPHPGRHPLQHPTYGNRDNGKPRDSSPPTAGFGRFGGGASGFTRPSGAEDQLPLRCCRMLARDCLSTCLHRSGLQRIAPPTMPSADFCAAVRSPYGDLSPVARTPRRPPEVRSTAFTARPPDLPPRPSMTSDFVRPGRPRYPVLVHRAAALLHASFRPHLAMTPLRFASNPSPSSGGIEDFHLQAVDHAPHTTKRPPFGERAASHGSWRWKSNRQFCGGGVSAAGRLRRSAMN